MDQGQFLLIQAAWLFIMLLVSLIAFNKEQKNEKR